MGRVMLPHKRYEQVESSKTPQNPLQRPGELTLDAPSYVTRHPACTCIVSLVAVLVALAGISSEARACAVDACQQAGGKWSSIEPELSQPIPTDGALLLVGSQVTGASAPPQVELSVTLDGTPVAGSFHASPFTDVLAWRPDLPFAPGATYAATGSATLHISHADDTCEEVAQPLAFEFVTDDEPMAPLVLTLIATETLEVEPEQRLEALVCCDGAMPEYGPSACGEDEAPVVWTTGFCAYTRGHGRVRVDFEVEAEFPAATAAMVHYELFVDHETVAVSRAPSLHWAAHAPFCARIDVNNFGGVASFPTTEQCFGDPTQFEERVLDPGPALAEHCEGPPQVCEVDAAGAGWDPNQCEPWPESALPVSAPSAEEPGAQACGCTAEGAASPSLLALAFGLACTRRRRSSSRRRALITAALVVTPVACQPWAEVAGTEAGSDESGEPAVCGDGVVSPGEACDDGNDAVDDGCNAACERTGVVEWTFRHPGSASAVALDSTGRIVAVGGSAGAALIMVLDPDGVLQWSKRIDSVGDGGFAAVAVDEADNIYAGGSENSTTVVRSFTLDAGVRWMSSETWPLDQSIGMVGLAYRDGALILVTSDGLENSTVRRHAVDTGAVLWNTSIQGRAQAVAAMQDDLLVAGYRRDTDTYTRKPLRVWLSRTGAVSRVDVPDIEGEWSEVAAIGDTDIVLAGSGIMRRVGDDDTERWTVSVPFLTGLAVGAEEEIAVWGLDFISFYYVRRFHGDGTPVWSSYYPGEYPLNGPEAAAYGPGFFVVVGNEPGDNQTGVWIRRFAAD